MSLMEDKTSLKNLNFKRDCHAGKQPTKKIKKKIVLDRLR